MKGAKGDILRGSHLDACFIESGEWLGGVAALPSHDSSNSPLS